MSHNQNLASSLLARRYRPASWVEAKPTEAASNVKIIFILNGYKMTGGHL